MHRRACGWQVELPCIDLGDVGQERRGRLSIHGDHAAQIVEQDLIGQVGQRVARRAHGFIILHALL
jgi:hypothetical protein